MRYLISGILLIFCFLNACQTKKVKDVSTIDNLLLVTDNLLDITKVEFDNASESFYALADDSSHVDSIVQIMNIPDSIGIYQYVEMSINDLNEIISFTEKEIYFAQDYLNSLKKDFLENEISKSEYLDALVETKELIIFLKERVDSNIILIEKKHPYLFNSYKDSVP